MAFNPNKKKTYSNNEGIHRVICRDAFELRDGGMRVVFEILSKTHPLLTYLAGKNYKPDDEKFMDDIINWLGLEKAQTIIRPDGSVEFEKLKGLQADIRIELIHNDEYEQPYSYVKDIRSPGTLTKFQSDAA